MSSVSSSAGCESGPDELLADWLLLSSESAGRPGLDETDETDAPEAEDRGKLKSRLVSAWNAVKYGWSLKQTSRFARSSPVIMLGKTFDLQSRADRERFRRCFTSLLWLTYRRGFPPLPGCSLTTDSGWGCVLRTGQMLLARGLLLHLMPADWTWSANLRAVKDDMDLQGLRPPAHLKDTPTHRGRKLSLGSLLDRPGEGAHRRVVSWFLDHPAAPFGIHQLVELGRSSGKKAGDWYGPSNVAHILRKAVAASAELPTLSVYVAQDCTIYKEDVRRLCERRHADGAAAASWTSVLVLVPVRLGGQELNPAYITCVKKLLTLPSCIGIIGGKPKHSLFFIGFQDDRVLYLDPHYCQSTVDGARHDFPLESFHCKRPRKMSFTRMDPSCTIGFYARGRTDFQSLCTAVHEVLSTSSASYPMFTFVDGRCEGEEEDAPPTHSVTYIQREGQPRGLVASDSMDEFVLL